VKLISTFEYEGTKTNVILQEEQYSCYTDLQNKNDVTAWVLIVTTPLAPLFTDHLWCYCTSNAITTVDRQSTTGIIEVPSGVPLNET
jgi:hypothetical protein